MVPFFAFSIHSISWVSLGYRYSLRFFDKVRYHMYFEIFLHILSGMAQATQDPCPD